MTWNSLVLGKPFRTPEDVPKSYTMAYSMKNDQKPGSPRRAYREALLILAGAFSAPALMAQVNAPSIFTATTQTQSFNEFLGTAGSAGSDFVSYTANGLTNTTLAVPATYHPELFVCSFEPGGCTGSVPSVYFFQSVFDQFSSNTGVLTGVTATMAVTGFNAALGTVTPSLKLNANEGARPAAAINSTWTLANGAMSASGTLASMPSDLNNGFFKTSTWSGMTQQSQSELNTYVGGSTLSSNISTTITVQESVGLKGNQKGNPTDVTVNIGQSPTQADVSLAAFAARVNVTYSFLQHAQASFRAGEIYLNETNAAGNPIALTVDALGDASTHTGLDFRGEAKCVLGDCLMFTLKTESFANVVAGSTGNKLGSVSFSGAPGNYLAAWDFVFWDTLGTGATASQTSHVARLVIEGGVTAVPEPHNAAMFLAGLGAIGWMSRRRRSAKDQFAKL